MAGWSHCFRLEDYHNAPNKHGCYLIGTYSNKELHPVYIGSGMIRSRLRAHGSANVTEGSFEVFKRLYKIDDNWTIIRNKKKPKLYAMFMQRSGRRGSETEANLLTKFGIKNGGFLCNRKIETPLDVLKKNR